MAAPASRFSRLAYARMTVLYNMLSAARIAFEPVFSLVQLVVVALDSSFDLPGNTQLRHVDGREETTRPERYRLSSMKL